MGKVSNVALIAFTRQLSYYHRAVPFLTPLYQSIALNKQACIYCRQPCKSLYATHKGIQAHRRKQWREPPLDGSVEPLWASGSGDAGEQGSTEDIIKTQINGHNLERDSAWVRVIISLVSGATLESKH